MEEISKHNLRKIVEEEVSSSKNRNLSIKKKQFRRLDGTKETLVYKVSNGSIIKLFDKTSNPEKPTDVVCPHFLELKWANGCPFDCSWCYLQGTFRFLKRKKKPHIKNIRTTITHLATFLQNINQKNYILNSGELSDSLLSENSKYPFSQWAIPLFEKFNNHKLLLVTKSTDISNLLNIRPHTRTIVSFSLNAEEVAQRWEKAPKPLHRIKAAKRLQETDYTIRLRIDPIIPIPNWRSGYSTLIDNICENLSPERIRLGSLRGLQSTINQAKDKSWVKYLSEWSNWGRKISLEKRLETFSFIIDYLDREYSFTDIALCKETVEVWENLGMDYRKIRCNCNL